MSFIRNNTYSIVSEKNVKIKDAKERLAEVKHLGKWQPALILKVGSHEYVEAKAKLYKYDLSLDTANEEESNKRIKRTYSFI